MALDWMKEAEQDLKRYPGLKESIRNLRDRAEEVEGRMYDTKGIAFKTDPVSGDSSSMEDQIIHSIMLRDRLLANRNNNAALVQWIERGLTHLNPEEFRILELFYMNRQSGYVERAMEELHCGKSDVYRRKNSALRKFVLYMYGLIES